MTHSICKARSTVNHWVHIAAGHQGSSQTDDRSNHRRRYLLISRPVAAYRKGGATPKAESSDFIHSTLYHLSFILFLYMLLESDIIFFGHVEVSFFVLDYLINKGMHTTTARTADTGICMAFLFTGRNRFIYMYLPFSIIKCAKLTSLVCVCGGGGGGECVLMCGGTE